MCRYGARRSTALPLHHTDITSRTLTRTTGCGEVSTIPRPLTTRVATHSCVVNRWMASRFNILSSFVIGCIAFIAVFSFMDAALAGFALVFSMTIAHDLLFMVRRFVGLEQAMVRHQFHVLGVIPRLLPPRSPSSESRNTQNWSVNLPSSSNPGPLNLGLPPDASNARSSSFGIL